jgi:hypothetical protein
MSEPRDPVGKWGLFSRPEDTDHTEPHDRRGVTHLRAREAGDPAGKAALYSTATRRVGTVVLDCSRCRGRTRVSYPDFARRHLPAWLWFPWREHSRLMVCPACGNRTWVAARWLR